MPEFLGFNAFFGTPSCPDPLRASDAAFSRYGFSVADADNELRRRDYALGDKPPWSLNFKSDPRWSSVELFVGQEGLGEYSGHLTADVLVALCEALKVRLGRSFDEGGHGVVREAELEGTLEFVDWFQYLNRDLAAGWSAEHLDHGPFQRVIRTAGGGVALLLGESIVGGLRSRREAADYLGISLRPLFGRNPADGTRIQIPWR